MAFVCVFPVFAICVSCFFAMDLPLICHGFAISLPCVCHVFALFFVRVVMDLPLICVGFAISLPCVCLVFAVFLFCIFHCFAIVLPVLFPVLVLFFDEIGGGAIDIRVRWSAA